MQSGVALLLHLFYRTNLPSQASKLGKFLLDSLQPFLPLAVSDVSIRFISASTPIMRVPLLNPSNLRSETPDLFP
jgi:hypothetical protein